MSQVLRIGTRGSKLALKQAQMIQEKCTHHFPETHFEIKVISTKGDEDKSSSLSQIGGKGVFIKGLERALLDHEIDMAVHSLKDVTSQIEEGLTLNAYLSPESQSDVVVLGPKKEMTMPLKIGTGSLRRRMYLHRLYPHWEIEDIRGNVETRIQKVSDGHLDGVVLSEAGLIRLNLPHHISHHFDIKTFLPAPGQGVIAVEIRNDDVHARNVTETLNDPDQSAISRLEMAVLKELGFGCQAPFGMTVHQKDEKLHVVMGLGDKNGRNYHEETLQGTLSEIKTTISHPLSILKKACGYHDNR